MAFLTIGDEQYEAKVSFKFESVADKKYGTEDKLTGLETIYQNLMSYKPSGLLAFWDCATAAYGKKKHPSVDQIAEALEKAFEESEDDGESLYKDAFRAIDGSGFFRLQLKEYWKNIENLDKMADDEKDEKQAQLAKEMFKEKREALLA